MDLPPKHLRRRYLQSIAFEFHRRAFGEELARVNFLPATERKAYLARIRERVSRHRER
jgi:uncharacterized protein YnzC (UPF0291/DUF896 family)